MPLHTVVREKRKALGLTQEQVALSLGVTAPAVNKWEKGATYPDVTLLPALARLLQTDVNTLLCFQQELSKAEIALLLNRVNDTVQQDGFAAGYALAMEKVREYPASAALLHSLAMVLDGALMMAALPPQETDAYKPQITALYERVAASDEAEYADPAKFMLASQAITDGQYETAQKLLDALPAPTTLDKRTLQTRLWCKQEKWHEAALCLERMLLSGVQATQMTLVSLAEIAVREGDDAAALRLAACGEQEALLFGLWDYAAFLVPLQTAVARKNIADCLAILPPMLAALQQPWDITQSPVLRHLTPKTAEGSFGPQFLAAALSELEHSEAYDFLRNEPAFAQLLETLHP